MVTLSPSPMGLPIAMKRPATVFPMDGLGSKASDQACKAAHCQRCRGVVGQNGDQEGEYQPISN